MRPTARRLSARDNAGYRVRGPTIPKRGRDLMAEVVSADMFRPHIGEAVLLPGGHKLTLVSVDEHSAKVSGGPRAPFSLILRGVAQPIVPEGLHRLTLEDGPSFELYLIPIHTPSRDRQDYQIVFN
jgi:hypothetical protein